MTTPPGPPHPYPPMPQYQGHPTAWDPWELDTTIVCPPPKKGCPECGRHGQSIAPGRKTPRPGTRTGHLVVFAFRCEHCGDVRFIDARDYDHPVSVILCDDCDQIAAVGYDDDEARASLVALGGWTGGAGTDWDRCATCAGDGKLRILYPTTRRTSCRR